jgi:hypothetical protein
MDFIVSKVAMSICALLVVSILGGMLRSDIFVDQPDELKSILTDLSRTLERAAWSGCEAKTAWTVPFLADHDTIEVSVRSSTVSAESGDRRVAVSPACEIHTWSWNGSALNASVVQHLDDISPAIHSVSGQAMEIRTQSVSFENGYRIFAFVGSVPIASS